MCRCDNAGRGRRETSTENVLVMTVKTSVFSALKGRVTPFAAFVTF